MLPSTLATKLQAHATILPSQRELLERVLFQIEFNGFQHIHLVGAAGTGKTTLGLVLAELFSDSMNLAYFSAQPDMSTSQCQQLLLQQWFGLSDHEGTLMQQLEQPQPQPLLWILDGQGPLPAACLSLLRAHPVHIITTGPEVLPEADLNLAIPAITVAEAESLLPADMLRSIPAAQRLQAAAGNLHLLLEPDRIAANQQSSVLPRSPAQIYSTLALVLALLLCTGGLVFWWLYQADEHQVVEADNQLRSPVSAWSPVQQAQSTSSPDPTAQTQPGLSSGPEHSEQSGAVSMLEMPAAELGLDAVEAEVDVSLEINLPIVTPELDAPVDVALTDAETRRSSFLHDEAELLSMDKAHYALQLGVFASVAAAERMQLSYPELPVMIYQRQSTNQLPQWVLVLASYAAASEARAIRATLPAAIQAETPFIKTIAQIWQEIEDFQQMQGNRFE
ncbi:SPOR domain-containing protein [Alkalimonas mucilaginosa]|uniref:SPOR domain-containing protein n=1 Tax=Alkalimonas mucilaginosa TaxID=3057676 RepID=A0ABU7JE32_9GAMM|nr:SPOR domain-containing protein [Alkalimonas sp. MEB004]MEE2023410.1 hypothetical protein [Alkalimonas sp. MEB004]